MNDPFRNQVPGLESPAARLAGVTPSDTADLAFPTRAIAVGTEGFVQLITIAGDTGRVFVLPGAPFPIRARRILSTGTSATDIVALA
ncbi:hypothetical protein ACFOM8_17650 [Paracoccus angustae]|uniref:Uncharacterized protein n=1 Tax=Paracoccus angustae TaxID=1671480 RepID=A0ABV7U859_9RHOB